MQVWTASSASDPGTQVYTSTSWSDPPLTTFDPPLNVPAGGGFTFDCEWDNTTTSTVNFGESATDEMCFFWVYDYPANPSGAQVCFTLGGPRARAARARASARSSGGSSSSRLARAGYRAPAW